MFKTEKGEGVVEKVNIFQEYVVVKYEGGEEEKISLTQLRRRERQKHRQFAKTTSKVEGRSE
jgi:DNA polymerase elongation subunit (family B)